VRPRARKILRLALRSPRPGRRRGRLGRQLGPPFGGPNLVVVEQRLAPTHDGQDRGARGHASDETSLREDDAHRVGRDDAGPEAVDEVQGRPRHLEQRQQMVRAVPRKKVVAEIGRARLPGVRDEAIDLGPREREGVFPQVAALEVRVLLDLHVVRQDVEVAVEAARHALEGVDEAVRRRDVGREVDDVVEELVAFPRRAGQSQEGVAIHRRRAVEVGRRVDERRGVGRYPGAPRRIVGTGAGRQRAFIEVQLAPQPRRSGREQTLRLFPLGSRGGRLEQSRQRGDELRLGIALTGLSREEEAEAVGLAPPPPAERRPVVQEDLPHAGAREVPFARYGQRRAERRRRRGARGRDGGPRDPDGGGGADGAKNERPGEATMPGRGGHGAADGRFTSSPSSSPVWQSARRTRRRSPWGRLAVARAPARPNTSPRGSQRP
jgi:hypothetical protein